jgi:hypothetical protein
MIRECMQGEASKRDAEGRASRVCAPSAPPGAVPVSARRIAVIRLIAAILRVPMLGASPLVHAYPAGGRRRTRRS